MSTFKNFFEAGVSLKELNAGHHTGKLMEVTFVEHPTDDSKSYVKLLWKLEDRVITDNRFEQGFNIFLNQIKRQLAIEDESITVQEVLDFTRKVDTLDLWISYSEPVNGRRYRNVNFLPPLPVQLACEVAESVSLDELPL